MYMLAHFLQDRRIWKEIAEVQLNQWELTTDYEKNYVWSCRDTLWWSNLEEAVMPLSHKATSYKIRLGFIYNHANSTTR